MRLLIDDDNAHLDFAPLTLTRPVGELRMGLLTNTERWAHYLKPAVIGHKTEEYLSKRYPALEHDLCVNARVLPSTEVVDAIALLENGEKLSLADGTWIAYKGSGDVVKHFSGTLIILKKRWDLYLNNEQAISLDYNLVTKNRKSAPLPASNTLIGDPNLLFIEEGAQIEASVINVKGGPVYIGKHAEVMEGSLIRGPFALLDHAALKMGAKIYGGTTIGPHCKVGGEVSNSIFYAYSNKGHDGFVGNSLIGEWCNLGADTNTSNLKNNYSTVRTYDYRVGGQLETGVTFMGLCMGDHSKSSINTMFNTASVTGVFTSVFSSDFPEKYLPSFTWGKPGVRFEWEKALEVAEAMMSRRGMTLSSEEVEILKHLYSNK
jgi:UDP-N-acetylglucosamine diphosphorylase/glucosamine-1-phosphate N-acetyltransferase